jgi:hypothetical protein
MDDESNVLPVTSNLGVVVALFITGNDISRDSLPHESPIVVPLPKKAFSIEESCASSPLRLPNCPFYVLVNGVVGFGGTSGTFQECVCVQSTWQIRRQREGVVRGRGERVG